ncbi:hypothetical protein Goari_010742 [Gossypium aridum]|uniref:Uncharacterized protein n=1 Tax=Gossypium aridum TaxID=34290 RepID=A0A7J8Y0Z1_GOSAI|nr:hypothetical protein [Gossypium aridum]
MYIGPIEVTKLRTAKVRARKTGVKIFYSKGWHEKVPVVIELDLCAVLKWLLVWSYKSWTFWNLVIGIVSDFNKPLQAQLVIILHQGKCMAKASFRRPGGNFCDCLRCSWLLHVGLFFN